MDTGYRFSWKTIPKEVSEIDVRKNRNELTSLRRTDARNDNDTRSIKNPTIISFSRGSILGLNAPYRVRLPRKEFKKMSVLIFIFKPDRDNLTLAR